MKIVIIRHGKVDYPPIRILSAYALNDWAHAYNTNALDPASVPSVQAMLIASQAKLVVCSTLTRSSESATMLEVGDIVQVHSLFNEADLPIATWSYPKLSVRIWAIFFRLAWLLGYSNGSETFNDAKLRARKGAELLIELAQQHGSVLLIGHGIINRLIARELRKKGWQGPRVPGNKYWEFGTFTYSSTD